MSGDDYQDKPQPLIEHLVELRTRLMWSIGAFFVAFVVCFFFAKQLYNFLVVPYKWAVNWANLDIAKSGMIYTAPQEFFFTQVKVAMFGAVVIAFPVIASQLYKFIAPGLYKNERAAFLPFLIASPALFLLGGALVYLFFAPMVMWFFLSMQQLPAEGEIGITLQARVSDYLSLIMTLVLSFGLVFQLPVVTTLLARVGILTSDWLREKRKFAIVIAFVVAAVLTPPDPMSQIGLAIPTILLYEISIYAARLVERKRAEDAVKKDEPSDVASTDQA